MKLCFIAGLTQKQQTPRKRSLLSHGLPYGYATRKIAKQFSLRGCASRICTGDLQVMGLTRYYFSMAREKYSISRLLFQEESDG